MRVAHLLHHLNPYGTERVVLALLKYRGSAFSEQFVVSTQDGDIADEMRATGCPVFVETDRLRLIQRLAGADLINGHCLYEVTAREMVDAINAAKRPYLLTLHWPTGLPPKMAPVIACTSVGACRAQPASTVCELIENGIDLEPYLDPPPRQPSDRLTITRICRPAKNSEYFWYAMADVMSSHPEVDIRIVGSLGTASGRVEAVGVRSEVAPILADTDLFVYCPKPGEGTKDLVVMEAMAMGVPAVMTDVETVRASAVQGKTALLVRYGDTEALTAAVETLVRDPELRRQLAANAREYAFRHFDVRHRVRRYEQVYARLLAGEYGEVKTRLFTGQLHFLRRLRRPVPAGIAVARSVSASTVNATEEKPQDLEGEAIGVAG
jgi:hypothetical protein